HRPTLWALHGVPLAINAGDALFSLAHSTLVEACGMTRPELGIDVLRIFTDACMRMIEGQHFDLCFEARSSLSLGEYIDMAARTTGALMGAALAIGGCVANAPSCDVGLLRDAGEAAGLAFQALDDALAIWGEGAVTGKAVGNDLERGKKSLP